VLINDGIHSILNLAFPNYIFTNFKKIWIYNCFLVLSFTSYVMSLASSVLKQSNVIFSWPRPPMFLGLVNMFLVYDRNTICMPSHPCNGIIYDSLNSCMICIIKIYFLSLPHLWYLLSTRCGRRLLYINVYQFIGALVSCMFYQ